MATVITPYPKHGTWDVVGHCSVDSLRILCVTAIMTPEYENITHTAVAVIRLVRYDSGVITFEDIRKETKAKMISDISVMYIFNRTTTAPAAALSKRFAAKWKMCWGRPGIEWRRSRPYSRFLILLLGWGQG
jgi:hypothetical protein